MTKVFPSPSSRLFTKLVLEAPIITESALEVIRRYCEDEVILAGRIHLLKSDLLTTLPRAALSGC